jgi:DNA-directed RNA polymerase subunit RPC12/RpoP
MSVIPEVKCRRCGESFSALRTRCPNCGTRRVAQSGRTPGATPGTVKGTASYERAETNTKWQMIFGLILVVAVILAVIVMVSTSLNGQDVSTGKVTNPPTEAPSSTPIYVIEEPPTPPPTPTPTVSEIKIFYYNKELPEFTMHEGDDPLTIKAYAYPVEDFADAKFTWSVDDESVFKITPSEDTSECKCEILSRKDGGVKLSVTCNGFEYSIRVYLLK